MHNNRRLFDLATKNSQKIAIDDYMRKLSEPAATLLNRSEKIFHPELSTLVASVISKAGRLQDGILSAEPSTNVIKTASQEKAASLVGAWIDRLPSDRYVFVADGGNGVRFDDQTAWISRLPGHYISLPDARSEIKKILELVSVECVLAGLNTSAAIVVDSVGGILPEEPSEHEVVFELSSWGLND